jgi:ABC-2 type transport system permease protein
VSTYEPDAQILDRGYRAYDGPRLGVRGAIRSLVRHSIERVLGVKRTVWAKLLPALAVFIAYVPAIVFVGITVLVGDLLERNPEILPTYSEYYGFISAAILVFTAFVAPELLCTDRRTGMLGLYLASPLTRDTYLLAKAIAVGLVLALVTLGPPLFMLIARTVAGSGPEGPGDVVTLFARIVVAGAAVAVLPGALSLAVSSVTSRKAVASAAIILILIGSAAVANSLVEATDVTENVLLLDLFNLPFELAQRVYGTTSPDSDYSLVSGEAIAAAYVAWTAVLGAFVVWRYRRIVVTR